MRPLDQWDRTDLEALITSKVAESLTLDYKQSDSLGASDGKKKEVAKDVSALANSAGGRLIYGIREQNDLPVEIDEGCDDAALTRLWLENVITSNISPVVQGVTIKPIAVSPGRSAYVIDIPQATSQGPHQASDKRYYKRFNFKSQPMDDYEVRDVMRRGTTPELQISMELRGFQEDRETGKAWVFLHPTITNASPQPSEYTNIRLLLDRVLDTSPNMYWQAEGEKAFFQGGARVDALAYKKTLSRLTSDPIYREEPLGLSLMRLDFTVASVVAIISTTVTCPGFKRDQYWGVRRIHGSCQIFENPFESE